MRSTCLVAIILSLALPAGAQAPAVEERAIPRGILDPKLPLKPVDQAMRELARDRAAAPALERYQDGDYFNAARLGEPVLQREPQLQSLRYAVANSLAWTGVYGPAIEHYRTLLGTAYDSRARLGMANALRWQGRSDLAEPLYRAVVASEPSNADALSGLELSGRELRPAVTFALAHAADNQNTQRDELSLRYRQWSADRAWRFEVGLLADHYDATRGQWWARGLSGAISARQLPLSPKVEVSAYGGGASASHLFGSVEIEPVPDQVRLRAGRVNWGRLAFNANAAADALTATDLGVNAQAYFALASVRGRFDAFDISDGNRVLEGELHATPRWQPLPSRLVWFTGIYGRRADREDARYWSPRPAYGLAFLGLQRNWSLERADVDLSVRRGFGFTDSAGNSWGVSASGRYWIRTALALGLEAWAIDTPRPAPYRMHYVGFSVQQLL